MRLYPRLTELGFTRYKVKTLTILEATSLSRDISRLALSDNREHHQSMTMAGHLSAVPAGQSFYRSPPI